GRMMSRIRIGLAQINATVGDFEANVERVRELVDRARAARVALLAFPELAICGYPPEDLLLKPAFARANRAALDSVTRETRGITAVVGFVDRGADLYNAAAILH